MLQLRHRYISMGPISNAVLTNASVLEQAHMQFTTTEIFIYGSIWGLLVSAGILYLTHRFSTARDRERERERRQREFLGFLYGWRSELERIAPTRHDEIWQHYSTKVSAFHNERGKVRGDFLPQAQFQKLTEKL